MRPLYVLLGYLYVRIAFVIPVFNERDTLRPLAEGIRAHTPPAHEPWILFVDDGSTDGSTEILDGLAAERPEVNVLHLRGNFGKSAALAAGFAHVDAELVFTMDSDLQDDPKEIPRFIEKLNEGYDVVCGWKAQRHDPWHKTFPSRRYNAFVSWLFELPIHDVNCGFKLFRREVVRHIQVYGEMHRLIPVLAHKLNYRVTEIPVEHHRRRYGVSKYGFERFFRGAADVLTMWFLTRYRHQPGHFFGKIGACQAFAGLLALVLAVAAAWGSENAALWGIAAIAGALLLVSSGVAVCMGLLAELMLHHFIRIDPALYTAREDDEPPP